jgi:hypothetical protein
MANRSSLGWRTANFFTNDDTGKRRGTYALPKFSFAPEIDGRLKIQFSTKEGAERREIELKRRFPMRQIRVCDAAQLRHDLPI